jgi:hypothetical protein
VIIIIIGQLNNNSSRTTPLQTTAPEPISQPQNPNPTADPSTKSFSEKVEYLNSRNARGDGLIYPYGYIGDEVSVKLARKLGDEILQKFRDAVPSSTVDENIVTYKMNIWPIKKITWLGSNDSCNGQHPIAQQCFADGLETVICKISEISIAEDHKQYCLDSFSK